MDCTFCRDDFFNYSLMTMKNVTKFLQSTNLDKALVKKSDRCLKESELFKI